MRIWNHQLLRYAGYESNGEVIGDSTSIAFTKECERLGGQESKQITIFSH